MISDKFFDIRDVTMISEMFQDIRDGIMIFETVLLYLKDFLYTRESESTNSGPTV